jgi:signal transduction histidine kinase
MDEHNHVAEQMPDGPAKRSRRSPHFRKLEYQARSVQMLLAVLLGAVALLPACVFFVIEMSRLREDADKYAEHCAKLALSRMAGGKLDQSELETQLQEEMRLHDISLIRLLAPSGKEVVRLGNESRSSLATTTSFPLSPETTPLAEIELQVDDKSLQNRAIRVLIVHLLVALLLGLAIYRIPVRALHRAIGELEGAEVRLRQSEKLSAIGEMYAGIAHEVNNPLGIILTRVKFMLSRARRRKDPREVVEDLEILERHGVRIAEIVRGLLAFGRKISVQTTETDVNKVVKEVIDRVEDAFATQNIQVQSIVDFTLPRIHASPVHLQQVFLNMLNNARDAMPDGGTIALRTFRDEHHLLAEVRDSGTGIAKEAQEKLFEPFFTTKSKGTGLGLSVSYGIVKAHGGEIEVESQPGKGALFRLILPINGEKHETKESTSSYSRRRA